MYDVLVIGGGPGGYAASIRASQLGATVALVEAAEIGGTCVNRGCIPSKVWLRAARLLNQIHHAEEYGIKAPLQGVNIRAILDRKNGVAADIRAGMEGLLANNNVTVIQGRAVLKNERETDVDGRLLRAGKIILSTGSIIDVPDIPGLEEEAWTSNQVLDMREIPSSALICGSGPIEIETATLLNAFGCKVTVAFDTQRILPREDHDTSQRISQSLREHGVVLIPRSKLTTLDSHSGGYKCLLNGREERTIEVEKVIICGRKPNTSHMGLEETGIRLNENGTIRVNEKLETSVKGIYAIGDVIGGWMVSHASSSAGITAAENAVGNEGSFPFHLVPRGLWTDPEVGSVGLSEEEAEKTGKDIKIGDFPYSINGLAMVRGELNGAVKVISDAKLGEILGVHIVGPRATDLIGEAVLAMQLESSVRELAKNIRVHPTFSESVVDASRDALDWALYLPKR